MTLAHSGTLPSVLQRPVETPTWKSSSLLNTREKRSRRRRRGDRGHGERKQRKEIKKERDSRQRCLLDRSGKGGRGGSERGGQRGGDHCHFAVSSCERYVNNQYAITGHASKGGKETTASRHRSLSRKVPREGDPSSGAAPPPVPSPDTHQSIAASLWDTGIVI